MMKHKLITFSLCGLLLAGCSSATDNTGAIAEEKAGSDNNILPSKEDETKELDVTTDETTTSPETASDEDKEVSETEDVKNVGRLKSEVVAYFDSTYGDYLKSGGGEAEFLHAGRYMGTCTDLNATVVYLGEWNDDTFDYSLDDNSTFLRLEGSVSEFFTGEISEMSSEDFLTSLGKTYAVTSEFMESGGTAYYISDSDFLHIEIVSNDGSDESAVLDIACKEGEQIGPDTYCWVMKKYEEENLFSEMPDTFAFSSGAGAWSTDIEIAEDGSFKGQYLDSDMGDIGDGYPGGTQYVCNFSGKFSNPEPTEKDHIYSMKLLELNIENEDKIGTEEIIDDILHVYSAPYGFDDAGEFLIYAPGADMSEMSEDCLSWIFLDRSVFSKVPEGYYVIYNIGGLEAFTGVSDESIWGRECIYQYGNACARFRASYYMGSSLSFFTEEDSPAELVLNVPWDGENTEPMECKRAWSDDEGVFSVKIEKAEGAASNNLKYKVTVESITNPDFDFSLWGGKEPGKFSAEFTEK